MNEVPSISPGTDVPIEPPQLPPESIKPQEASPNPPEKAPVEEGVGSQLDVTA
ncbi:MAG: hypothetical protein MI717_12475 [Spirochaetales bacterium]|nr:hypothetical protein [Spirochaetales bacterium]